MELKQCSLTYREVEEIILKGIKCLSENTIRLKKSDHVYVVICISCIDITHFRLSY